MKTLTKTAGTLVETIENYDANDEHNREELERFQGMTDLKEAVGKAAGSLQDDDETPYPHQQKNWNFWPESMRLAARTFAARSEEFQACKTFEEVHTLVETIAAGMKRKGLGELYRYDVAFRIGARLGLLPRSRVYLHAGTRKGAERLLNLNLKKTKFLELSEFPAILHGREPWEVENILCGYSKRAQ